MACSEDIVSRGSVVNGYTFHECLGTGAFSSVYRVVNEEGTEFAMKVIPKENITHDGDPERLQRELDTMAFLKHPNIVSMHNFFSDEEKFYLVLDYCPGGDLADFLVSQPPLREQQVANVFRQIVTAIAFVHSHSVAHRDLKPQNILITKFPNVKVTDFGLCGYIDDEKMKTFCGSPCYTAPECLSRVQYDGALSDVWSLGVILYVLVTGHHPWNVTNIPKMIKQITSAQFTVPSSVSPACDDLIKSMLKVRPTDRLTCEKILAHPWMKLAPSRRETPNKLPPLLRNSLLSFTQTINRDAIKKDHGVVSPFEGQASGAISLAEARGGGGSSTAITRSRSTSLGAIARSRQNSMSESVQMQRKISTGLPPKKLDMPRSPRPPIPKLKPM